MRSKVGPELDREPRNPLAQPVDPSVLSVHTGVKGIDASARGPAEGIDAGAEGTRGAVDPGPEPEDRAEEGTGERGDGGPGGGSHLRGDSTAATDVELE